MFFYNYLLKSFSYCPYSLWDNGLGVVWMYVFNFKISKAIEENEYSIGIFFDIAKAFDTVNHAILLKNNLIFTGSVAFSSAGLPAILQIGLNRFIVMAPSQNYVVFFSDFPKVLSLALFCFLFIFMTYQIHPVSCTSCFLLTTPTYSSSHTCLNTLYRNVNEELKLIAQRFHANKLSLNL